MSQNDTPKFAERFAYVVWLRAAGRPYSETDNAIADGANVTRQWIQKWLRKNEAPNDRLMTRNLVRYLNEPYGWDLEAWLLDGQGIPPRPELWTVWVAAKVQLAAAMPAAAPRTDLRQQLRQIAKGTPIHQKADKKAHDKKRRTGS